jgi:ornithine lipid ester-linked acyl 2-hydroxylase
MVKKKIWYSFYDRKSYSGEEPSFFDKAIFPETAILENYHQEILTELQNYLKSNNKLTAYFSHAMVSRANSWKTIPLMTWGVKFHKNIRYFPKTYKLLKKIPGLVSVSFNQLEANSEIKPHFGDTNAIARSHLGLVIPGKIPEVGFKVRNEERSWDEGKLLFFCDGYEHTAWNYSSQDRYILLLDIVRPEFISKGKLICGNVLGSLFLQSLAQKLPFLIKTPLIFQFFLHVISKFSAILMTPIWNGIGFLIYRK